jgi:hypothetical protein
VITLAIAALPQVNNKVKTFLKAQSQKGFFIIYLLVIAAGD